MNSPFQLSPRSIIETVLLLLLLLALLFALYDVLRVFFGVFTFAIIFAVSFSNLFEMMCAKLKNRRKLTATIYSVLLIGIIATPFVYIISALSRYVKHAVLFMTDVKANGIPPLPDWITGLPYVGVEVSTFWQQLQERPKEMLTLHEAQIRSALHHILTGGMGMIGTTFEFIAGIIISAIFLVNRNIILRPLESAIRHLLGEKDGPALITATGKAVRGVAIGVMGTAFIAAIISWIGFAIAGLPFALGLAALIFFLVVIQVGPLLVWVPLVIWLVVQGHPGMAVFLSIYGVLVLVVDSVLKPVLIAKSGKLPFLVLFLGVVGGMVAWGFTGMFKGAIILAVFYTIFNSWLEKTTPPLEENPAI